MKPGLVIAGVLGVVLVGGGIAFAASSGGNAKQPALPSPNRDVEEAKAALRTGQIATIQNVGIALATSSPAISAGLVRGSAYLATVAKLPSDVQALIVGAVRTVDESQMKGVAAILQTKGQQYNQYALDLASFAEFVGWLNAGAPIASAPQMTTLSQPPSLTGQTLATSPITSGTVNLPTTVQGAVTAALPSSMTTDITTAEATDIANLIATGNPATIRQGAARYRKAGRVAIADSLDAAAKAIEQANQGVNPATVPTVPIPSVQQTATPATSSAPAATTQQTDPRKKVAAATALAVKQAGAASKGKKNEPKTQVQVFQTQEQLARTDGSYGSETALALAEQYGIVPTAPWYWGAKGGNYQTLVDDKKQYNSRLAILAARDPQRQDEWKRAMVKV